ncbi:MAG: hypothetical protein KC478_08385, partial [Bacteriovoracaceae bacterium]|nr:hypothetical protein [Bacteriovoracaceae bacterium]
FTSLPWLKFSSISHARHFEFPDSIPKMACGKIYEKEGSMFMPISLHVHHALLDGYHVSLFYSKLEELFKSWKLKGNH